MLTDEATSLDDNLITNYMNIKLITLEPLPSELVSEAAHAIRLCFTQSGQAILARMSDQSVLDLWQYGLREVEQLSEYNQSRGMQAIQYPHIWLKKYLFTHVYANWLAAEDSAKALLKSLEPLIKSEPRRLRVITNTGIPAPDIKASCSMPPIR